MDLIASHGQTVFHAPKCWHGLPAQPNATFQIGDGDHIAALTGFITVSDFRQKHVALGGEGAPLVLYGDYFLYSKPEENRVLLNIGGISNFTFLPASSDPKTVLATDCGPGNTLIDWAARTYFNVPMDTDGLLAEAGNGAGSIAAKAVDPSISSTSNTQINRAGNVQRHLGDSRNTRRTTQRHA